MEELRDVSIHHMALKILSDITHTKKYDENIFKTVQVCNEGEWDRLSSRNVISRLLFSWRQCSNWLVRRTLIKIIWNERWSTQSRWTAWKRLFEIVFFNCCEIISMPNRDYWCNRWVFWCARPNDRHYLFSSLPPWSYSIGLFQGDPLNYLRRAGILWERRVRKSLNSMCTELEVTLQGQPRSSAEKEELANKWDELSNYQIGKIDFRYIFHGTNNWLQRIPPKIWAIIGQFTPQKTCWKCFCHWKGRHGTMKSKWCTPANHTSM